MFTDDRHQVDEASTAIAGDVSSSPNRDIERRRRTVWNRVRVHSLLHVARSRRQCHPRSHLPLRSRRGLRPVQFCFKSTADDRVPEPAVARSKAGSVGVLRRRDDEDTTTFDRQRRQSIYTNLSFYLHTWSNWHHQHPQRDCYDVTQASTGKHTADHWAGSEISNFAIHPQWCKQDRILKTKTKTTGSKQRHSTDLTFK